MSGRAPSGNPFPNRANYIRVTLASLMERAQSPSYRTWQRIEWAALARMNKSGHAIFERNELRFILGRAGPDGWQLASSQAVTDAIRKAKQYGVIGPESGARCLVIDTKRASQGFGRSGCDIHAEYSIAA